ncbi:MAG: two-component regulator propeller domain-containing protein [Clostridium sp.]|uniref:ligand-binding sensor domain-containing protein n=1 Tax=Clostridium sp. TaxID=1506 RepID=UPI002FC7D00F
MKAIKKKKSLFVILLIIFLMCNIIISNINIVKADAKESDKYLKFTNLTVKEGLSQGSVYSILKDKDGYMWFGTNDGLNRFDGYNYTVIKSSDKDVTTLHPGIIGSIVEDNYGYLWIGTSSGLSRLNKKTLKVERIDADVNDPKKTSSKHIWDLYIDSSGNLWVGTENGLNKYDFKTGEFKKYFSEENNLNTISGNYITSIMEGKKGEIWLGTKEGVSILDEKTDKVTRVSNKVDKSLPSDNIIKLYKDSKDNMWVSTQEKGVVKYDLNTEKADLLKNVNKLYGSEKFAINSMYEDEYENVWLGSKGGLIKYSLVNGEIDSFQNKPYDPESLVNNSIQSVYRDDDGLMWIGTYSGISIVDPGQKFTHYKRDLGSKNTLSSNSIGGIYEDDEGILWIGTTNDGLNKFNRSTGEITQFKFDPNEPNSIPSNTIFQVIGDKKGNIWVATKEGIAKINKENGKIKVFKHEDGKNSLSNNDVKELFIDNKGLMWIGTREGLEVFNMEKEEFTNLNYILTKNNIEETYIRRIFQDSKNNYWIATGWNGGLIKLDVNKNEVINYKSEDKGKTSISNNAIKGINEDSEGNIWLTTSVGLNKLDVKTGEFKVFTEEDGLANNYVYGVLIDEHDNIWVSTNGGLSKYDKKTNRFENFTYVDGIQSNEFNGTSEYKSKSGEMFFGGVNGITAFYPKNIYREEGANPKVTISDFKVYNNNDIRLNGDLELKHNENTFSFEFFLPDYRKLGDVSYEYMLEGLDENWIFSGERNYVNYTNIKPGNYTFKVRSRNRNGKISDSTEVKIKVKKAWYNSTLAYIIYIILLLSTGYFILNYVKILNGLVRQRTNELNRELVEKEAIYNELLKHEKFRNTYLVNLSHELRTPLNVILSSEQLIGSLNKNESGIEKKDLSKYMSIIKKNSKTLLKVINDLIDNSRIQAGAYTLKIEETDIVYLVEEITLSMKSYIESNKIDLIIDPEIEEKLIECDKTNIERCVINLVSNAVKFTKEHGTIFVGIEEHGDFIDIIVRDSGVGIPKEQQDIIFDRFAKLEAQVSSKHCSSGIGLTLVKNLVELHNGKISLVSEVNKGSEFRITLPIKHNKKD